MQKYFHEYTITELPASTKENGMRYFECTRCGEGKADLIPRVNSVKLQSQSFVYSGKTVS